MEQLIEIDELNQTLTCRWCKATEEILRRQWQREDRKLEAIERFTEDHISCAEQRWKWLKIRFWSMPFRHKTKKNEPATPQLVRPKHALLSRSNRPNSLNQRQIAH